MTILPVNASLRLAIAAAASLGALCACKQEQAGVEAPAPVRVEQVAFEQPTEASKKSDRTKPFRERIAWALRDYQSFDTSLPAMVQSA